MASPTNFVASTHQGRIIIEREEGKFRIEFSPSEIDAVTKLIGLTLSIIGLPQVPNPITNPPFVVRVFPNQAFALERQDRH